LERSIRGLQRSRQNSIIDGILSRETYPKKHRLGPQNGPGSSGPEKTAKNSKLPKLPETCFGPVGKGGWPPISTWIITGIRLVYLQQRKCLVEYLPNTSTTQLVVDIEMDLLDQNLDLSLFLYLYS
jgi:hypothetical protein